MATLYFQSSITGHGTAGQYDDNNNWWALSSVATNQIASATEIGGTAGTITFNSIPQVTTNSGTRNMQGGDLLELTNFLPSAWNGVYTALTVVGNVVTFTGSGLTASPNLGKGYAWTKFGRQPTTGDSITICDIITSFASYPASITLINIQVGTTSPSYNGLWDADLFGSSVNVNATTLTAYGGGWWASNGVTTISGASNFYSNSYLETGTFTSFYGTGGSTFHSLSSNGGPDAYSVLNGNATFNDYSSNGCASGGPNDGYIYGNVIFNNFSTNCSLDDTGDTAHGYITGNATFNSSSQNCLVYAADNLTDAYSCFGTITGNATFNGSSTNFARATNTDGSLVTAVGKVSGTFVYTASSTANQLVSYLQDAIGCQSITMPTSGGGVSKSNILLTELLKLPFPIVL